MSFVNEADLCIKRISLSDSKWWEEVEGFQDRLNELWLSETLPDPFKNRRVIEICVEHHEDRRVTNLQWFDPHSDTLHSEHLFYESKKSLNYFKEMDNGISLKPDGDFLWVTDAANRRHAAGQKNRAIRALELLIATAQYVSSNQRESAKDEAELKYQIELLQSETKACVDSKDEDVSKNKNDKSNQNSLNDLNKKYPQLETDSGDWVRACEKNKEKLKAAITSLNTYRKPKNGGRISTCKMYGEDSQGRFWRRKGTAGSHVYYYVPTLLKSGD